MAATTAAAAGGGDGGLWWGAEHYQGGRWRAVAVPPSRGVRWRVPSAAGVLSADGIVRCTSGQTIMATVVGKARRYW